jgi:uncharacterized ferritin-like protein (DUF455 family)
MGRWISRRAETIVLPPPAVMQLREFARRIVASMAIDEKLAPAEGECADDQPGLPERPALPGRPPELVFCGRRESPAMPHPETLGDPARRAVAHHIMANHELQALEVMAFVLLAFPEAPSEFRQGLARIMADEQRHTRMHIDRLEGLGLRFGAIPVNGYFWKKAQAFGSLLEYLAGLPLTFEGGNLDHTLEFEALFERAGDTRSAAVMRAIHRDEIQHVAFGLHWLRALKPPGQSDWDAYTAHLQWPLRPEKSRGTTFHRAPRLAAGMEADFVDRLEQLE